MIEDNVAEDTLVRFFYHYIVIYCLEIMAKITSVGSFERNKNNSGPVSYKLLSQDPLDWDRTSG